MEKVSQAREFKSYEEYVTAYYPKSSTGISSVPMSPLEIGVLLARKSLEKQIVVLRQKSAGPTPD